MRRPLLLPLLLATSCGPAADAPPFCGDGVVHPPIEECDDGPDNGDAPDACRADCTLPRCGDGIVDAGEQCDDGDRWGGDGCSARCELEVGTLEVEPNDTPEQATPLDLTGSEESSLAGVGFGSLPLGDVDCWSVDIGELGYVQAAISTVASEPGPGTACGDARVRLALHDSTGAHIATGAPANEGGCAVLDPSRQPGARYLEPGRYAICVAPLLDREVRGYRLDVEVGGTCDRGDIPFLPEDDIDGDGVPNICDDDSDGDGILDVDDNCPYFPNAGDPFEIYPDERGFLRTWLAAGPLVGQRSPDRCLPTDDRLEPSDSAASPELVDPAEDVFFRVIDSWDRRVDLVGPYGYAAAPREAYLASYVFSETERQVDLALGPDDGARAWLNGEVVLEDPRCQGTRIDARVAPVTLRAGWNRLLLKVYDQGGGWGLYARFKVGDEPVTDLLISLTADGVWRPDQSDFDGDGVGDACDPFPGGR